MIKISDSYIIKGPTPLGRVVPFVGLPRQVDRLHLLEGAVDYSIILCGRLFRLLLPDCVYHQVLPLGLPAETSCLLCYYEFLVLCFVALDAVVRSWVVAVYFYYLFLSVNSLVEKLNHVSAHYLFLFVSEHLEVGNYLRFH